MAEYAPMSELRKPAIVVLLVRGRVAEIQPVLWGMEEEGIPFEIQECSSGEVIGVAKEAAHISPLPQSMARTCDTDGRRWRIRWTCRSVPLHRLRVSVFVKSSAPMPKNSATSRLINCADRCKRWRIC